MSCRNLFRAALLCGVGLPMIGCTLTAEPKTEKALSAVATKLGSEKPDAVPVAAVAFTSGTFYGSRVIRSHHGVPLPAALAAKRLTITDGRLTSLSEFAALLSEAAGVAVRVEGGGFIGSASLPGADPTAAKLLAHANGAPGLPLPVTLGGAGEGASLASSFVPNFRATPLDSILDFLAQRFDCDWSYNGSAIVISQLITRTFEVRADPSVKQISAAMSGAAPTMAQASSGAVGSASSSNGTDDGGSKQETSVKIDLDIWKEVTDALTALVPTPGKFVAQRASGVVTVVASPTTMRRVSAYFEELNQSLSQRVAVEITAIYINTNDSDDFGISLSALYKDAKSGATYGLADLVPAFAGSSGSASFAISSPTSAWNGTQELLKGLASNNRLVDVETGSTITQNGVPASIKLTTNTDIVRSIQFNTIAQAGAASTAASAVTVPTGFSLQVLPRVVGNSEISLLASIENSAISSETQRQIAPGSALDLLTTTERNFGINVVLGTGEEVATLGYDQYTASRQKQGLGWVGNLLDGHQQAGLVRTRLLLIMRAVLLKPPAVTASNMATAPELLSAAGEARE